MTGLGHRGLVSRLRNASMLLRIQDSREQLSRLQLLQASRLLAGAQAEAAEAHSAVERHAAAKQRQLHAAHDALRGHVISLALLAGLTELEQDLAVEAARVAERRLKADDVLAECRRALTRAEAAAWLQRRKQRRKQAVVERAAAA